MSKPNHDPSIEHEPHLRGGKFASDPSEKVANDIVRHAAEKQTEEDQVEHSVWDEPSRSPELTGQSPPLALNYSDWIDHRISETTATYSWLVTLGVAALAGPLAFVGTFLGAFTGHGETILGITMIVVFAPMMEEMMKVAMALWIVEKKPYLFLTRAQIAICALASGFVFAACENFLYLNIYVPDPSSALITWRWTVCGALHMACALVASMGLMRIWTQAIENRSRPQLALGTAYIVAAVIIHGSYNLFAILLEMLELQI